MICVPKKKSITRQLHHTIRILIIENGIIASSPFLYSQAKKTNKLPADPQKSPIIVALPHAYFSPPHCKANRSMMAVGAKRAKPGRSRFISVSLTFFLRGFFSMRSGMRIKKRMAAVTPPAGRLIQKPVLY